MDQAALEARLAAIAPGGNTARLEFSQSTVQRKVTKPNPQGFGAPIEETVSVPVLIWIDRGTGATIRVVTKPDGTYETDFDGVDPKNKGEAASAEPGTAKPRQSRVNPSDPTKLQEFDPDAANGAGAWVDAGVNQAGVQAAEDRNKPTVTSRTEVRGGKTYTVTTSTPKDGKPPTITVTGPDGKPVPGGLPDETGTSTPTTITRNGKTYIQHTVKKPDGTSEIYYTDQAGARVALPDEAVPGGKPLPSAVPPFRPDHTKPEYGLGEWIDTYLMPLWRDGKIDKDQVTAAVSQATGAAKSEETRISNITRVQENQQTAALTQRAQDITRANAMATTATTGMTAALGESERLLGLIPPGSWNGSTSTPVLAMQAAQIGGLGGGGQFAPVQPGPLLAGMNQFGAPAGAGPFPGIRGTGAMTPAVNAPAMAASPAPYDPAAAATGAAQTAQAAAVAAGGVPMPGEPGGPPLQPGPILGAPAVPQAASMDSVDPTQQGRPAFTPSPIAPTPPMASDGGNEQNDDILTIYNPQSMQTVRMTRAQFMEFPPESRAAVQVVNAEPNPSRIQSAGLPPPVPMPDVPATGFDGADGLPLPVPLPGGPLPDPSMPPPVPMPDFPGGVPNTRSFDTAPPGRAPIRMAPQQQQPVLGAFATPFGQQFDLGGEIARMRARDPLDPGWQAALDELILTGFG